MKKKDNQKTIGANPSRLVTYNKPKSVISEKFRGIRTNILFSTVDQHIDSLVVTSAGPASGKSTISANIAVTFAQAGYRTLLIDGDMRKPTQHYIFNKNNLSGLSNLIINREPIAKVVQQTQVENLELITSGPTPPNPSELIGSQSFETLFNEAKEIYDFILIDTPPVNSVTDAQLYAELASNAIFVINAENNNRDEVKKGINLLKTMDVKILGAVLNKAIIDKSSSMYYYYGEED